MQTTDYRLLVNMYFIEALKLAAASILGHKLRSFLTLLGVIFGVATVIIVVSLIEGFNSYVDEKIADIGTNAFSVQKYSIEDYSSVERLEHARKYNKDIRLEDYEGIKALRGKFINDVGATSGTLGEVKYENVKLFETSIQGVSANIPDINRTEIAEGRSFTPSEEEHRQMVCFIGSDVAEKFFPKKSGLGEFLRVDGRQFKVIGVAKELGSVFGQSRDKFVIMPLMTFLGIYGERRSIQLKVTSVSEQAYEDAVDEVRATMRTRRKLPPSEPDNFGIVTPGAINNLREKIFGTIQVVAVGVTSIALVVGGIVIMNIMLVSVTERTKEIGIRKSLGARRSDILKQFLVESVALAFIGGAFGVLIAWGIAKLVEVLTPIPTSLPLLAVAVALFVSGSVGLISGIYPAWRAARLDPITAMRAD
ncbi:MAG TPA: ABC transporter permease [Blastocatellia bacterium]|nr:ABC transporter permease [Blastocatellia bacterium]